MFINIESNQSLMEREAAEHPAVINLQSALAAHIQKVWQQNRDHREYVDDELLRCLRQRNNEYDPEDLAEIRDQGGSEIYMGLTATKCRAAESWLTDVLMPADGKPWGIDPTVKPEVAEKYKQLLKQKIAAKLQMSGQNGEVVGQEDLMEMERQMQDELDFLLRKKAEFAATGMENTIEDQLQESGWMDALSEFVTDFCTFPAAIMKGPIARNQTKLSWDLDNNPVLEEKLIHTDERVSPFDIYPSPGACTPQDGDFIERMRISRKDLYDFIGVEGFKEEQIRMVLTENSRHVSRWLFGDTDNERFQSEQQTNKTDSWFDTGKIDALHYWGYASGEMLAEWGLPCQLDPNREYHIEAIQIGEYTIKCRLVEDGEERPYLKACYMDIPGGFWGKSVPQLMRDHQRMCNGTARALANNMGMASGPQVVLMTDMLPQDEEVSKPYPWKLWQAASHRSGQSVQPIHFFQPNSNAEELLAVYQSFDQMTDEATGVPRYIYGDTQTSGAAETAQGLSALMEAAGKGIRNAIRHIDRDVIRPRIQAQFRWNMLHHPDRTIKFDSDIVAKGSAEILIKANAQQRRNEFMQITANEFDMSIIGEEGRRKMLDEMSRGLDMRDRVVPTEEEFRDQMQQNAPQEPQIDPALEMELAWKAEQADLDRQHKERLAMVERETAALRVAADEKISLQKVMSMLQDRREQRDFDREQTKSEMILKHRLGPMGNLGISKE